MLIPFGKKAGQKRKRPALKLHRLVSRNQFAVALQLRNSGSRLRDSPHIATAHHIAFAQYIAIAFLVPLESLISPQNYWSFVW